MTGVGALLLLFGVRSATYLTPLLQTGASSTNKE
jgi:hypothetical protein